MDNQLELDNSYMNYLNKSFHKQETTIN